MLSSLIIIFFLPSGVSFPLLCDTSDQVGRLNEMTGNVIKMFGGMAGLLG